MKISTIIKHHLIAIVLGVLIASCVKVGAI